MGFYINLFLLFFRVSRKFEKNKMSVFNLGVVFGPTLLRPQEETVAAILDIKFNNIVINILIENYERIFKNDRSSLRFILVFVYWLVGTTKMSMYYYGHKNKGQLCWFFFQTFYGTFFLHRFLLFLFLA